MTTTTELLEAALELLETQGVTQRRFRGEENDWLDGGNGGGHCSLGALRACDDSLTDKVEIRETGRGGRIKRSAAYVGAVELLFNLLRSGPRVHRSLAAREFAIVNYHDTHSEEDVRRIFRIAIMMSQPRLAEELVAEQELSVEELVAQ